ncbi:MAG: phage tail assembly chaperone [Pseudomonadota bacterium]
MIWAIGAPGQAVRIYMEGNSRERADRQQMAGEVTVEVESRLPFAVVTDDGATILAGDSPPGWDMDLVRARRTALLAASQWVVGEDSPLSATQKDDWLAYRQALRDVPQAQPDATLDSVVWPISPEND